MKQHRIYITSIWLATLCFGLAYLSIAATLNVTRIRNANMPPVPTNFFTLYIGSQPTNVFLSWDNAATYSTIQVERSTDASVWTVITNIAGTNVAFTNLFTWTNQTVYYRLKVTGTNGLESDYSN